MNCQEEEAVLIKREDCKFYSVCVHLVHVFENSSDHTKLLIEYVICIIWIDMHL